jgi:PIN domain nuclease of toxin-antitoxin system
MNLLLDTHAFIWWLSGDASLGAKAEAEIGKEANLVFVSAVTAWEMATKHAAGKLDVAFDIEEAIADEGFHPLPVEIRHAIAAAELPMHHKDPFDRVLVAQARLEELTLVAADAHIARYRVKLLDAST